MNTPLGESLRHVSPVAPSRRRSRLAEERVRPPAQGCRGETSPPAVRVFDVRTVAYHSSQLSAGPRRKAATGGLTSTKRTV